MSEMYLAKLKEWNGSPIEESRADGWVERGVRQLQVNPEGEYFYTMSGDRLVLVCRRFDQGPNHFEVMDCIIKRYDEVRINEEGEVINTHKPEETR